MRRLVPALWVLAASTPVWAASPALLVDLGAGGGYDDNLNNATSAEQREGSMFGTSWLTAGVLNRVAERLRVTLNGAYSGTYYAEFDDLTVNALSVRSSGRFSRGTATSFTVGAGAGRRWYGDDERNATVYEFSLGLRERFAPRFSLRAGYRYASRAAEVSTYSSRGNRFTVDGEFQPDDSTWIGLGYGVAVGQSVFYESAATPTPSNGRGRRPSSTFGANQVAFKDDTTTHTLSASWEQGVAESLFARVEYAYSLVTADAGDAQDNLVWGSVGYRY
ncbi:MAG: hypothetical protein AB1451_00465 [Nitrospirota bacterium]